MIIGYADWSHTDILKRFENGESVSSLAKEYGVSRSVMGDRLVRRQKLLKENELYSFMYYSEVEVQAKTAKKIVNCMKRAGITTIDGIKKLSRDELLGIRYVGIGQLEVMEELGWIEKPNVSIKKKQITGKDLNLFVAKLERKIREDLTVHYPDDETDEMICISCKDLISFVDDVFHDFLKEEVE